MQQNSLDYERPTSPHRQRGVVAFWILRISAITILVLTGLRFWGYLIAFISLIASNAARGKVGDAFDECIAAATPFALSGILFILNEYARRWVGTPAAA